MLEIKDLHAEIDGKEILRGFSLTVPKGEVHAIMGPNGSGKSTLSYVIAGKEEYEVTGGSITWDGKNLLEMTPDERAHAGVFLAFQYPMEIPGVASLTFLRTAMNAHRKALGQGEISIPEFMRTVKAYLQFSHIEVVQLDIQGNDRQFLAKVQCWCVNGGRGSQYDCGLLSAGVQHQHTVP